jgi:hypothetical protein
VNRHLDPVPLALRIEKSCADAKSYVTLGLR